MKRGVFLIVCIILCVYAFSQESTLIKGKGYKGYAFNKDHFVFMSIENQKERYTPIKEDIIHAEKIINDSINSIFRNIKINKHLLYRNVRRKYKRQYVGFLTKDGDIIVWINFLRGKEYDNNKLSKDIIQVFDGGENYWSIFVNLTKNTLYGMRINGIS
jgi:hypothetical protein